MLAHAMAPLAQDAAALDDDVIRRPSQPPGSHSEEDVLYQVLVWDTACAVQAA